MRRAVRWLRNAALALGALFAVAVAVIYALSERAVRRTYDAPLAAIAVPTDAASIAEGQRLAHIRGCTGCHGRALSGGVFVDDPWLARVISPNLTTAVRQYSDAELARIIRRGVRPGGRGVVVMPSSMFSRLTDGDLGKILAYLHSVPARQGPRRDVRLRPLARLMFALGEFEPEPAAVRRADSLASAFPPPGDATYRGAYLARTACAECHGLDLRGGRGSPDLRIAAGYTPDQFARLMRTGRALGDRELRLMSDVARARFRHFTDDEIRALHGYLVTRATAPDSAAPRP